MSEKNNIVASARVRITVEVPTSNWGKDCSVEQIMDQAGREASNAVRNHIECKGGWKIVGEPEVVACIGVR